MAKTTISRALKDKRPKSTVGGAATDPVLAALGKRLKQDRVQRRMTWQAYAAFLGVKLSTVYKIATGATTKPQELTLAQIEDRLAIPVTAEGAADAVVSGGQRHPERSEN